MHYNALQYIALHPSCIAVRCIASIATAARSLIRAIAATADAGKGKGQALTFAHPSPGGTASCPGTRPLESDAPGPQASLQTDWRMHCPDQTGWAEATGFSVSASHRCTRMSDVHMLILSVSHQQTMLNAGTQYLWGLSKQSYIAKAMRQGH